MKNLLLTLMGILLLAPINLLASTSPSDWKREMEIASHQAVAYADLSICLPLASGGGFEGWSCEKAVQGAIRVGLELDEIIISVVARVLTFLVGDSFNESNLDKKSLVSDINLLITRIDIDTDSIDEENIFKVSRKIILQPNCWLTNITS